MTQAMSIVLTLLLSSSFAHLNDNGLLPLKPFIVLISEVLLSNHRLPYFLLA